MVKKHLTYEICQRKFGHVKGDLLLYCCEDVKSHRSGGDTVPLNRIDQLDVLQPKADSFLFVQCIYYQ